MTKNASEIVENIINNRIDNDETIDAGIASDIVCNEKLMKLIDETSSWDVILKESSHNGSLIIASAALNRATRFKDAIPFLHITPKYLHEKALSVMEKYALTSEEFLFLATQHSNEKKKSIFFSKGVGYAKNYKESLVALDYLLRSKNSIQNQDLIFASISKTISFARKFKEESWVYDSLEKNYAFDCNSFIPFKCFFESVVKNYEIDFFGKKTIERLVRIGNSLAIIEATELFKAIIIIEKIRDISETTNFYDDASKDVFKRFYQNNP